MKFTGCLGIMVSSLILFVVCSLTFFSCVSSCDYSCSDKPVITPSRLVVKFGDPASATCVACQQACLPLDDSVISMEASLGYPDVNGTKVTWTVDQMTEWKIKPKCYYTTSANHQCCSDLPVTVYKPPENVSFSIIPSEPLTEGTKVTLQCDVLNVVPVANLIVTFYRGQTPLGEVKSNDVTEEPVSETFSLSYNTRKEDDGVQFWCEAKLELGAEGPQPPLVVKSEEVTATVYYGPQLKVPADPAPIRITRGEPLHLTCLAEGNPKPQYSWTLPSNKGHRSGSDLKIDSVGVQDGGQYVCTVSNNVNSVIVTFNVTVQENFIPFIIGAVVAAAVVVLIGSGIFYSFYYKQNKMGEYRPTDAFCLDTMHHPRVSLC
ncbi:intercellular adhesion molecule 1-like isoform X2 [Poecilia formosa]|uniref:intercellular adhesion molecule 1-like isoform X2 n=1 Tax=Poecilia formosa TaxID=48698 RepID=UPI000443B9D6|nr:PREDICTED: intercellular adhesion molecule 1-like isoform X2 [Poecilia formosa]